MNRSAACIRMLLLLKARGFMTRSELAKELNVNRRNIREYKKELEEAGYVIESTLGKFGGYKLHKNALLPIVGLNGEEVRAIREADEYLKSHTDFLLYSQFKNAIDKIQANTALHYDDTGVYMQQEQGNITKKMKDCIQLCEYAKKEGIVVDIVYKSINADVYQKVRIHPYEILNYKGAYYCFAYSLKAKDYRNFKFSEERMQGVSLSSAHFQRDPSFHLKEHIGITGLMKDEIYELDMLLYKESAVLISEKQIGIQPVMEWIDKDTLHFTTIMEGKINVITFVMSLGNQCKLLAPLSIQQEIIKIAKDMLSQYSYS